MLAPRLVRAVWIVFLAAPTFAQHADALAIYLTDVYGATIPPDAGLQNFNWLYWSSAAALASTSKPVRVWLFSREYMHEKTTSPKSEWWTNAPPSVRDDMAPGDGAVHMQRDLGFFRWGPPEPASAVTSRRGHRFAEVLRSGMGISNTSKEDDIGGIWFYATHGSGFWLDLGRELDTTCSSVNAAVAHSSTLHHLTPDNARRSKSQLADLHQHPIKLNCSTASGSTRVCQPHQCRLQSCRLVLSSDAELCMHGLEDSTPPMIRSRVATAPWTLHHSFDTATKWSPELFHWWLRASPKEVVDLRAYGTPRCWATPRPARCQDQPYYWPCGGWEPQRNASSLNVRTGWQASGAPCSGCANDGPHLNCGPRAPPAAAHAKSIAAYTNGSGLGPVRGQCLLYRRRGHNTTVTDPAAEYKVVNRTAASPQDFMYKTQKHCAWAWFHWP